jgi:hypothetical protein
MTPLQGYYYKTVALTVLVVITWRCSDSNAFAFLIGIKAGLPCQLQLLEDVFPRRSGSRINRAFPIHSRSSLFERNGDNSVDEEPKKLILGEEIQKRINEMKSKYPTSEDAYLDAARKRTEEYQKKKELGLLDDEADSSVLPKGGESSVNFGPESLNTYTGFPDEGWEASLKNNGMASLIGGKEESDVQETPSLLIIDSKSTDGDEKFLLF